MNKKHIVFLFLSSFISLISCNDFLGEIPDSRLELDSKEKIRSLLTSAYSNSNHILLTELSSDNVDDTGSINASNERSFSEITNWQDVSGNGNDDPVTIWENAYLAIGHSNHALVAIENLKDENLSAERGEALITRAYSHFNLVNIFAKHFNSKSSEGDLGIPYSKTPETTLNPTYKRNTVAEVYREIEADIEEALPLIDDDIYTIKNFHFNRKAANAFAARFYLYYGKWDKAYKHASLVLEEGAILRDWSFFATLPNTEAVLTNQYISDVNNLLVQASTSTAGWVYSNFNVGVRINHTKSIADNQTLYAPLPWSGSTLTRAWYQFEPRQYEAANFDKTLSYKIHNDFETTDPIARIGNAKTVLVPFTTDETLLVRAEALIMLNRYSEALDDINKWSSGFYSPLRFPAAGVTLNDVNIFYDGLSNNVIGVKPNVSSADITSKNDLNPAFEIRDKNHENMLHYLLHSRRVLTLHEGLRWFDIKRYGIEINRYLYLPGNTTSVTDVLTKDDLRRAIQLPQQVISAGLTPNPR